MAGGKKKKNEPNIVVRNVVLAICFCIVGLFLLKISLNVATRHGEVYTVPDFSAMSIEEAKQAAAPAKLRLEIFDSLYVVGMPGGVVLDQLPKAGARVKSERRVLLTINSHNQRKAQIPYVAGYSLRQAKNILLTAGFEIERLEYVEDMAMNNVLTQYYKGQQIVQGSQLEAEIGSGIVLQVGFNPDAQTNPVVPRIVGRSLKEAKSMLWEAGYNVGDFMLDVDISAANQNDCKVYKQEPNQAEELAWGEKVTIYITTDGEKVKRGVSESDRIYQERLAEKLAADSLALEAD
ncbi:MAG: PASTA domain-containing protein [Rikenellaceae bacterium]|nr:PASTA domain-containing protein [Rikenellaceae bacterium]